jgi:hypothetical protein
MWPLICLKSPRKVFENCGNKMCFISGLAQEEIEKEVGNF